MRHKLNVNSIYHLLCSHQTIQKPIFYICCDKQRPSVKSYDNTSIIFYVPTVYDTKFFLSTQQPLIRIYILNFMVHKNKKKVFGIGKV